MKLDNNTRLAVLLGKPLGQSMSVCLQNATYKAEGLNMIYLAEETEREDLGPVLNGLRRINFSGCGITKPYKVDVMAFLDEIDPLCEKIGACNTIVNRDGKFVGYNTDAEGFYRTLTQDGGVSVEGGSFFCIGAGGAGRAICAALAHHGAKQVFITDRFADCARELAAQLNERCAPVFHFVEYDHWENVAACQAVINASGVGMGHSIGISPMPKDAMQPGQLYFDACYNPSKTQFLLNAEKKGAPILNGLGMLIYQGIAQIELWSGRTISQESMRQEVLALLKEQMSN